MQTSRSDYSGTLKNCQVRGSEHLSSLRALQSSNDIFTLAGCAHPVQYKDSMRSIENLWPCALPGQDEKLHPAGEQTRLTGRQYMAKPQVTGKASSSGERVCVLQPSSFYVGVNSHTSSQPGRVPAAIVISSIPRSSPARPLWAQTRFAPGVC